MYQCSDADLKILSTTSSRCKTSAILIGRCFLGTCTEVYFLWHIIWCYAVMWAGPGMWSHRRLQIGRYWTTIHLTLQAKACLFASFFVAIGTPLNNLNNRGLEIKPKRENWEGRTGWTFFFQKHNPSRLEHSHKKHKNPRVSVQDHKEYEEHHITMQRKLQHI